MVSYRITCPSCASPLKSAKRLSSGKKIRCLACGARFRVPEPEDNRAAPGTFASAYQGGPGRLQELQDAISGGGDWQGTSVAVESPPEAEEAPGTSLRPLVLVSCGTVGLLLVAALAVALVTSTSSTFVAIGNVSAPKGPEQRSPRGNEKPSARQEPRELIDLADTRSAGDKQLSQDILDQWTAYVEWLIDVPFTQEQRRHFQALFTSDWAKLSPAAKASFLDKTTKGLPSQLAHLNNYQRDMRRAERLPPLLNSLLGSKAAFARWLLEVYQTAHRSGGERNPVLVPGSPPLTQSMVNQYGDFIEWVLDLKLSGGLTRPQRQVLGELVVDEWMQMNDDAREHFVEILNHWRAIALLAESERLKQHEKINREFVADLRDSPDDKYNQWLLEIHDKEQELVNQRKAEK